MVTAPAKPPATLDPCAHLLKDDVSMSRFAMEVARDMLPFDQICACHGITQEEFQTSIVNSLQFQKYYSEYKTLWEAPTQTDQRVAIKAAAIVEDFLPKADELLHDDTQGLQTRNDLLKTLVKLAGLGTEKPNGDFGGGGPSAGTRVIINLPHARVVVNAPKAGDNAKDVTLEGNSQVIDAGPQPFAPNLGTVGAGIGPIAPQPTGTNTPSDGELRFGASVISSLGNK